jgi:sulfite reductase (ferredoxin)
MDLEPPPSIFLDLRGVACPLNWAKAKAALEELPRGAILVLETDDPRSERDIPGAAEAEGWVVIEVTAASAGDAVRITIER